jgi:hypothetical protein
MFWAAIIVGGLLFAVAARVGILIDGLSSPSS